MTNMQDNVNETNCWLLAPGWQDDESLTYVLTRYETIFPTNFISVIPIGMVLFMFCAVTGCCCLILRLKRGSEAQQQAGVAAMAVTAASQQPPYPRGVQSVFGEGNVTVPSPQSYPPPPPGSYPTHTYPGIQVAYPTQTHQSSAVDPSHDTTGTTGSESSSYTTQDMPPNAAPLMPPAVYQPWLSDSNQPPPSYVAGTSTDNDTALPPPSYDEWVAGGGGPNSHRN